MEDVHIPLDRTSGIPLYVQIRNAFKGALLGRPRMREMLLPPQRELAARLGVSRNTVSMAYAELERHGLVTSRAGKGTVVVGPGGPVESRNRRERLFRTIEHSVEEALAMGFTLDDYFETAREFFREKKEMLRNINLVFVECNREQLAYFSDHLRLGPGVVIRPVLLTDIRRDPEASVAELRRADIVVTSFYHVEELDTLLGPEGGPLVTVNLQPEMSTIVRIARVPGGSRMGLVAASEEFLAEMEKTLRSMGIEERGVRRFAGEGGDGLAELVAGSDALVVSPSRRAEVAELADGREVVEFLFAPDEASANNIRVALLEAKRRRKGEEVDASADS